MVKVSAYCSCHRVWGDLLCSITAPIANRYSAESSSDTLIIYLKSVWQWSWLSCQESDEGRAWQKLPSYQHKEKGDRVGQVALSPLKRPRMYEMPMCWVDIEVSGFHDGLLLQSSVCQVGKSISKKRRVDLWGKSRRRGTAADAEGQQGWMKRSPCPPFPWQVPELGSFQTERRWVKCEITAFI